MHVKKTLSGLALLLLTACAPAVPANQMPGGDLYSNANSNRMTADAALQLAHMQEQALTATSQAPIVHITETSAALTVQAAQAQATSAAAVQTQSGALTATAVWWTPTANATQTAAFAELNAQNTAIANNLERDRLQLERQQSNNAFWATMEQMAPLLGLVLLCGAIVWLLMQLSRRSRYQVMQTDARGNVVPVMDIVEGSFTDVDRSPNFRGSTKNDWFVKLLAYWVEKKLGAKLLLPEVTAERQDLVTHRDQMLDLATRGLPTSARGNDNGKKAKAGELMSRAGDLSAPRVLVVSPDQVRPILTDVLPQIAQDSIEAEIYERKEEGTP